MSTQAVTSLARSLVLAILTSLLTVPSALLAQQLDESMDVRLIQVPVVAWHETTPIRGLTKDDFEVFINGTQQPIAYFDVLEFGASTPAAPKAPSLQQRRLTVLVFDVMHSSDIELRRAHPEIEKFVNAASPDDYFAVAVYVGSVKVRYVVPFTRDRASVLRAIGTFQRSQVGDPLALGITTEERAVSKGVTRVVSKENAERSFDQELAEGSLDLEKAIENGYRSLEMSNIIRDAVTRLPTNLGPMQYEQEMRERVDSDAWMKALGGVADDLAPLEGMRQVALFSAGSRLVVRTSLEQLHRRYRAAGAILNIIDVAGERAPDAARRTVVGRPDPTTPRDRFEANMADNNDAPPAFFSAALGTGGRVLHGSGVANSMRILSQTTAVTYLLAVRPPAKEKDHNEIKVRIKGQASFASLSHRTGYSTSAGAAKSVTGLLLADVMTNDIASRDLTVKVYTPAPYKGALELGVPSEEILTHAVDGSVTVDFYFYVFDEAANVVGAKHRRMKLEAEKARAQMNGAELVRREQFPLQPGNYTAKALVHITGRDLLGFVRKDFKVAAVPQ